MTILRSPEETPLTQKDLSIILHYLSRCKHEIEGNRYLEWADPNSENGKMELRELQRIHDELSMVKHRSHSSRKYWKIVPAR